MGPVLLSLWLDGCAAKRDTYQWLAAFGIRIDRTVQAPPTKYRPPTNRNGHERPAVFSKHLSRASTAYVASKPWRALSFVLGLVTSALFCRPVSTTLRHAFSKDRPLGSSARCSD